MGMPEIFTDQNACMPDVDTGLIDVPGCIVFLVFATDVNTNT